MHPFKPVLVPGIYQTDSKPLHIREALAQETSRLYARGASDDKGGVMSILNAYTALKESGISPSINIKFFFEGEEE
ncbi:M20/M25/M40 family metallo-hydrolase, partial [Salmonella enterica]|uniref:M20/M25/M40 family metallo-hydrolase n=1 Tax=Salmonella enterica TaxID=28901 RepID=UPI003CEBF28E